MKKFYAFALCFGFFTVQILFGQARENIIGKWVNESGVTVVEITSETCVRFYSKIWFNIPELCSGSNQTRLTKIGY
jgi:hypothetical protein